jgi:hypothetical protein
MRVAERIGDLHDPRRTEAEFYIALCSVRLFNDDAGYRLKRFMTEKCNDDFSWKRGNRRFIAQGLYLPSRTPWTTCSTPTWSR